MKLSTKGRYGLKAMYFLGVQPNNELLSLRQLSVYTEVKEAYLEKLLGILKRKQLIESVRGTNGGYKLAKTINDITVGEILRALEGDLVITDCVNGKCKSKNCPNKEIFKTLYEEMNHLLDSISLKQMIEGRKK